MWKLAACAALILFSSNAYSCSCSAPQSPADVRNAVHIFEGIVTAVEEYSVDRYKGQKVTFKVSRRIAGPVVESVKVTFGMETSCDLVKPEFEAGQTWIISDLNIYVEKENDGAAGTQLLPSGSYYANYCSLRQRVLHAQS